MRLHQRGIGEPRERYNLAMALRIKDLKGTIDFGIITVKEEEFTALLSKFDRRETISGKDQHYEICTVATPLGTEHRVAITRTLDQGPTPAHEKAVDMRRDLRPKCILLVGIAGSPPSDDHSLGDVVLASRLVDFSISAAVEGRGQEFDAAGGSMTPSVEAFLGHLPAWDDELKAWNTDSESRGADPPCRRQSFGRTRPARRGPSRRLCAGDP